jgi:hypothetical protein
MQRILIIEECDATMMPEEQLPVTKKNATI